MNAFLNNVYCDPFCVAKWKNIEAVEQSNDTASL